MMKKSLLTLICTLTFFWGVMAQITRPMTARYTNTSVKGNIVFVANNIVTTPSANSAENPPGVIGTSLQITSNNGAACTNIDIDTDVPAHNVKIPFGSVWNYHSNGAAPANDGAGVNWKQPAYAMPAAWNALGTAVPQVPMLPPFPGKYGFGTPANPTIATCIKSSAALVACAPLAASIKYSAYYFRKTVNFTAAELAAFSTVLVNMKRLDGIVVYINGVERVRDNMPAGAIAYGTFARANLAAPAQENTVFYADPSLFTAGVNTIAVEVHTGVNTDANMVFDMQVLGIDAASTFNSSSATLGLNSCSQVLFAGLYWGANHQQNANSDTSWIKQETKIKFKVPGSSSYQIVTSTQTDYHNGIRLAGLVHAGYASFADVTSLINTTNPNGIYTAGDITTPAGWYSGGAGWTLVIAYSNPSEIQRNLTVFDGSAIAKIGVTLTIPITGFLTPPAGLVSCELGAVVYDGDRTLLDNFLFKQDANPLVGSYTNMTPNTLSLLNDMWNSTISTKGVLNPGRVPSHRNTLGFDADIIEVPNLGNAVLGNNQTSASVRMGSTAEDFMAQVLTTSISIYNPSFSFDKSAIDLNGGAFLPGDSLLYKIKYSNLGNDSSVNTIILDNLPSGTAYVPGSIKIGTAGKTDAVVDDEAEYDFANNRIIFRLGVGATSAAGGRIGSGVIDSVEFKVVAASSCQIVSCVGSLRNNARINYGGKLSGNILFDSSGVLNFAGCVIKGPVIHPLSGPCFVPKDTVLVNRCNTFTVSLPYAKYAGYTFYSATPFIPANVYNQYTPVTSSGIYWAYYTNGAGCSDTARIAVIITGCPDIDDDNDGIPDYVEFDNAVALLDAAPANGIPNWNDPTYPGYVNNNFDNVNDNFDYGADSDNDGIPNFYDTDFPGFVDTNGDGVNDNSDKDLDGIPNQYDLDSDNDGIPDTVESYGVETNGDGLIDSYTDTDADGFSQNVDANNTGVSGSGNGLGAQDFDTDGIPNYLDTDSDNDGIPDVVEVFGPYVSNSGRLSNFADANSDGISDNNINGTALLITGPDGNSNGRADTWPNKNFDSDFRPNAYDIDADADGILDVIEAGLPDIAAPFGTVDGVIGANGWSTTVSGMPSLNPRNTDGVGNPDYLDIDADDDGIPDNIEGLSTVGYKRDTTGIDGDGDGLVNIYETAGSIGIFGGAGNGFYDHDIDGIPDYRDLDTDADGQPDIIEGNDFNLNGLMDDLVTLTGLDGDGDGLDDRFDSLNSVTNIKGTSYRMGTGGTLTGDPAPGSRTTVQKRVPAQSDRDWRSVGVVLPVEFLKFTGTPQNNQVSVGWTIIALKEIDRFEIERSIDNAIYTKVGMVTDAVILNQEQSFAFTDDITGLNSDIIYYRLKVIGKGGEIKYSNILVVRKTSFKTDVTIMPNPANSHININLYSGKNAQAQLILIDKLGRKVLTQKRNLLKGDNKIYLPLNNYAEGVYAVIIETAGERVVKQFIISR